VPGFPSSPQLPPLAGDLASEELAGGEGGGPDPRAVDLVAGQAGVERGAAVAALRRHNGDVMRAIMELTSMV
jgi:NACalpha-BTF3-like transcription factor